MRKYMSYRAMRAAVLGVILSAGAAPMAQPTTAAKTQAPAPAKPRQLRTIRRGKSN